MSGTVQFTTYTYDPVGNRILKNDSGVLTTSTYNPANQLLNQVTGSAIITNTYDNNGNWLASNAAGALTTNTWDDENRLIGIANPDGTLTTNTYAANGQRRRQDTNSGSTLFLYDENDLLLETDINLVVQARYTNGYGDLVGGKWNGGMMLMNRSGTDFFSVFDPSNNIRALVNNMLTVTDSYQYKAFGEELNGAQLTTNPFRFGGAVGYYRDFANFYKIGLRDMDALIARWLSRIPFGMGGWLELDYPYVGNNPLGHVDPTGLVDDADCLSDYNKCIQPLLPNFHGCVIGEYGTGFYSDVVACIVGCLLATSPALVVPPAEGVAAALCATGCGVIGGLWSIFGFVNVYSKCDVIFYGSLKACQTLRDNCYKHADPTKGRLCP